MREILAHGRGVPQFQEGPAAVGSRLGAADGIDGLPGDDHGHYGGLAGAGGHLEGNAVQFQSLGSGRARQASTWRRIPLMIAVGSLPFTKILAVVFVKAPDYRQSTELVPKPGWF